MKTLLPLLATLLLALPATAGVRYQPGPLPDVFTLPGAKAFLPADRDLLRNEMTASKELARLSSSFEKCFGKAAKNFSKGRPLGLDTCLGRAQARYESKVAILETRGPGLPTCTDYRVLGTQVGLIAQAFNASTYCASVSGALVDGPILY
jgi:hypothetical protein